ncbi:MAG: hypothetical protein NT169_22775 [Chloroflexi bacterium]|nr:hypothetical protein [Chloroflexota bacterium]
MCFHCPPQVLFHTFVGVVKDVVRHHDLPALTTTRDETGLRDRVQTVADNLDIWGPIITKLRERDEKEWELLRIQIEKAVRRYGCPATWKEDALQQSLMKILGVANMIPETRVLESSADLNSIAGALDQIESRGAWATVYDPKKWRAFIDRILKCESQQVTEELTILLRDQGGMPENKATETSAAIVKTIIHIRASYTGVYSYSSPFYAYAGRIARNELMSQFRRAQREPDSLPWEDQIDQPAPEPSTSEEDAPNMGAILLQRRIDLTRLLAFIQPERPRSWHWVALQTLAARPQFWLALAATELAPPPGLSQPSGTLEDEQIAEILSMDVNNLRVQRNYAIQRVKINDPMLGRLLERLMAKPTRELERTMQGAADGFNDFASAACIG